ncbi:MAG: ABC transporter permease [Chloroflexi bacterium]|nr:ABC transporter permease [Chloroflexota bacterium]
MIRARWYKVLNDLWGNKTRTILIVLSIAVGLFAVGMIVSSQAILSTELAKSYATINPSSGTLRTNEPFDDDFVQSVRRMPEVQDAEGRRSFGVRFRVRSEGAGDQAEEWRNLQVFAVPDYANMRINKIRPVSGAWPPPEHELLIERAALQLIRAQVGDVVLIETPGRQVREMRISGLVHDLSQLPAPIDGTPYGYIAFDTLEWIGEPRGYNELHFVARDGADKDEAQRVVNLVKDKAEKSGLTIPMSMTAEPGQVPLNDVLQAILLLLGVLGVLSLLLSAFLIVNTISALLAQQVRQVGVMKAIGARTRQIMGMYLVMVLIYGVVALLLAVPLGTLGARALSRYMASLFNFDLTAFHVPPQAIVLQVVIGLAVPVLASLVPILSGLRVTAAQAMNTLGLNNGQFGKGFIDRL